MPDNVTHIKALANKWRRSVTNRELLELIEYILEDRGCPDCEAARLSNRERQARHRAKRAAC